MEHKISLEVIISASLLWNQKKGAVMAEVLKVSEKKVCRGVGGYRKSEP